MRFRSGDPEGRGLRRSHRQCTRPMQDPVAVRRRTGPEKRKVVGSTPVSTTSVRAVWAVSADQRLIEWNQTTCWSRSPLVRRLTLDSLDGAEPIAPTAKLDVLCRGRVGHPTLGVVERRVEASIAWSTPERADRHVRRRVDVRPLREEAWRYRFNITIGHARYVIVAKHLCPASCSPATTASLRRRTCPSTFCTSPAPDFGRSADVRATRIRRHPRRSPAGQLVDVGRRATARRCALRPSTDGSVSTSRAASRIVLRSSTSAHRASR